MKWQKEKEKEKTKEHSAYNINQTCKILLLAGVQFLLV